MLRLIPSAMALSVMILMLTGCPPKYPKCDKDDHCKEGEYCVNGMCQQCRDSKDCPKGQRCNKGRCEAIPGYCESRDDCPDGQICTDNRCGPCSSDADCAPDGKCKNGRCLMPGQCIDDEDCPENHECRNGSCVAPPPDTAGGSDPCSKVGLSPLPTVYFDFDEFVLTSQATRALQEAVNCLKKVNRKVRLVGHCDPRGTEEYNLALGDRRARSVKRYLVRLGGPRRRMRTVSKGKLEATGYNEETWARDRKVVFIWE
jgi:peptidoglycan-associated lipoprotein